MLTRRRTVNRFKHISKFNSAKLVRLPQHTAGNYQFITCCNVPDHFLRLMSLLHTLFVTVSDHDCVLTVSHSVLSLFQTMCILLACIALINLINRLVDENSGEQRPVADHVEAACYLFIYVSKPCDVHYMYVSRDVLRKFNEVTP